MSLAAFNPEIDLDPGARCLIELWRRNHGALVCRLTGSKAASAGKWRYRVEFWYSICYINHIKFTRC